MKRSINILVLLIMVLLSSCTRGGKQNLFSQEGDTLRFKYARNICVVDYGNCKKVLMKDPWSGEEGWKEYTISKPYCRLLVGTSVHCAVFEELGCAELVKGVCESKYIKLPYINKGIDDGTVKDCGSATQPSLERVVSLQPDAILLSPYQGSEVTSIARYEQSHGVPVIALADYMEPSPLARAEWIIFYGMLVGKEDEARKLFAEVERSYLHYKAVAKAQGQRPSVMLDKMVQATWFVPDERSTIGQMIADANCRYALGETDCLGGEDTENAAQNANKPLSGGSLELSYEQVLDKAMDADIWLLRYSDLDAPHYNLEALAQENHRYTAFKPFKTGKVYGCDVSRTMFFEETPFHPDRLLKDFIMMTHPEAFPNDTLRYYKRLV